MGNPGLAEEALSKTKELGYNMGQKVLGKERKKGFYCNGEEKRRKAGRGSSIC